MCDFCQVNPSKPCVECGKHVCVEKREQCPDCGGWICPECVGMKSCNSCWLAQQLEIRREYVSATR